MDTNNPQFQAAYNDLVGAFFRFINVVNPSSPEDQVRLICNSLQSLLGTLGDNPYFGGQTATQQPEVKTVADESTKTAEHPVITEPVPPVKAQTDFSEKRFAPRPTFTGEEVYKFINKQLKKDDAFDATKTDDPKDMADYPFILQFDAEQGEGVFTLNDQAICRIGIPAVDDEVIKLSGNPSRESYKVIAPGKVVKNNGWEVVAPLQLGEA